MKAPSFPATTFDLALEALDRMSEELSPLAWAPASIPPQGLRLSERDPEDLLTNEECAAHLRCDAKTVRRHQNEGRLAFIQPGKSRLVRVADLLAFTRAGAR